MQSVVNKVGCSLAALLLSVACCLGPYAQAAYANAIAVQYVGAALASIIAVLGVSPKVDGNVDFTAIGEAYTSFVDGMAEAGADILKDNVAAWDKTLTEDIDWDNIGATISASTAELARMGEAGVIDLNALSMSGAFGLLPALLSLFMADQVSSGEIDIPPASIASIPGIDFDLHVSDLGISPYMGTSPGYGMVSSFALCSMYFAEHGQWGLAYNWQDTIPATYTAIGVCPSNGDSSTFKIFMYNPITKGYTSAMAFMQGVPYSFLNWPTFVSSELVINSSIDIYVNDRNGFDGRTVATCIDGIWSSGVTVTDNPDVNLGHDYWDDAKANKDILNPAAGASVVGSDLVIDGDYIANRGSLGVITDWADINSWADALARAHAGVAEGALDGTISTTQTGTAVDVGTGELVTDTVVELVKPGGNTSISPAMPGLFDGVIDAVSDKFPFCIPGDLHKCLLALGAAPVAPSFDWTFPLHHVGLTDVTIHIDLAPFDQVAMILRVCLSVTMTIGLIFLSIRLLNMWGGH